ncbi:MAG: hypothetical protein EHM61_11415 [Acidobacteria bacterium]|nr:MAG: hypothetical protein EHM61_11415 [Acidobacteriota bacterium]
MPRLWSPFLLLGFLAVNLAIFSALQPFAPDSPEPSQTVAAASSTESPPGNQLSFEQNLGQFSEPVKFLLRGPRYRFFLTEKDAVLTVPWGDASTSEAKDNSWVLRWTLTGSARRPAMSGLDPLPGRSHYFRGRSPESWHTDVTSYSKVRCEQVYPGVDVVYYLHDERLEFDFVIQPGADPAKIKLRFTGARPKLSADKRRLSLQYGDQSLTLDHPNVFQLTADGAKREVPARYSLISHDTVGFDLGDFKSDLALVIDPAFVYSTFFGGSGADEPHDLHVDAAGNAYITGYTSSTNFPTTSGIVQGTKGASDDAFVFKMNPAGQPIFSTYLGGNGYDQGRGIAVDQAGTVFVSGRTSSTDFPTTAGAFKTAKTGQYDLFVTKLSANGSSLVYSTFLGVADSDARPRIAVDSSGRAVVAGQTLSGSIPVVNAFQGALKGTSDGFVLKLNAAGSALLYSTFLGGNATDAVSSVALDPSGNAWVVGGTDGQSFPLKNAFQTTSKGREAFAAKFAPDGSLLYSTYLGGDGEDGAADVVIDSGSNPVIVGSTFSTNFPVTPTALQSENLADNSTAFIARIKQDGTALLYSTYLGGKKSVTHATGIAIDGTGNIYVTGDVTGGQGAFPLADPVQMAYGGYTGGFLFNSSEAFVTKMWADGSAIPFSSYLGGMTTEYGRAIGVDSDGFIYVTGSTNADDTSFFPIVGAYQAKPPYPWNVFVSKIDPTPYPGVAVPPIPSQPWTRRSRGDTNHNGVPDPQDETTMMAKDGDYVRGYSSRYPANAEASGLTLSDPHPVGGFYQTLTRRRFHYYEVGTGLKWAHTLAAKIDGYDANLRPVSASVTETWDNDDNGTRQVTTKSGGATMLDSNQDGVYEAASVKLPGQVAVVVNPVRVDVNNDGNADFITLPWALVQTAGLAKPNDPQWFVPLGDTNGDGIPDSPAFDFDGDGKPDPDLPTAPFVAGPPNPTVEHRLYFAQFGEGADAVSSRIMLMNLDRTRPAAALISLTDDAGGPLSVDLNGAVVNGETTLTIPAGGLRVLATDGKGPVIAGAVTVRSNRPLSGVIVFGGAIGLAGVGSTMPQAKGFAAPVEAKAGQVGTGIAAMNLEDKPVRLSFELYRPNNTLQATGEPIDLPARGHRALFLNEIKWSPAVDLSNLSSVLRATATGTVGAILLRTQNTPGELATLPVAPHAPRVMNNGIRFPVGRPEAPLDYNIYFPQFADGSNIASQFLLLNLDPWRAAKGRVRIKTNSGGAMTVDLNGTNMAGEQDCTVPVAGTLALKTDGAGALQVGAASVASDRPLAGIILYEGGGVAAVGASTMVKRFVAPVENQAALGVGTGIAVMNLEATAANITFELWDENGIQKSTATLEVPPNGHVAKMLTELTWTPPVDLNNILATIRASSNTNVAATVLRTQFNLGQFATLPVSPQLQ